LYRALKRTITQYGKSRPDMTKGCPERFSWELLSFIFHFKHRKRPGLLAKLDHLKSEKAVYILKGDTAIQSFLTRLNQTFHGSTN